MKKMIYVGIAAVLLAGTSTPASASTTVEDGDVGLVVKGKGLKVDRAGGWMDGHGTGVKARLYAIYPEGGHYDVRGWKDATPVSAGGTKFSDVDWKLNKKFKHGTRLCIQFNKSDGIPCARIHR